MTSKAINRGLHSARGAKRSHAAKKAGLSADQRAEIDAALGAYGARLTDDDRIAKGDKVMGVQVEAKGGRLKMVGGGNVLSTYPASRAGQSVSDFVEKFWFWRKDGTAPAHATKKSAAQLDREIAAFLQAHPKGTMAPHAITIPDRGYMVSSGTTYLASFGTKNEALRFARGLAEQTRETYDIVKVQNRGEDRFIVDEVGPPAHSTGRAHHATKRRDPSRGEHVMMTYQGRELLGTVRHVRRDNKTGVTQLIVHHFNGEPWPVEPRASAVRPI